MRYHVVTLLTDYGIEDGFAAACHGVLLTLAPRLRLVDVTHLVPPQDVRRGAAVLAQTVPWLPPAVHVAVVDPDVGTSRRGIAVAAGQSVLVGPDNGLLLPAAEALGGILEAVELTERRFFAAEVSRTFHGRDVFAPVAAHVAGGAPLDDLGPAVDPASLVRLPPPLVVVGDGMVEAEVLAVDRFGNVQLAAQSAALDAAGLALGDVVSAGAEAVVTYAETFGAVAPGALLLLVDSAGYAALAVNRGSAAATLRVAPGDVVVLHRKPGP
ncbi:MAG TPA: SAM-dependent chlorinase/fluorinase [Actinomycetales bacterium]|nr:SAM-dependent chlorinase/fluorinase [Actinomycetales bacterium]